LVGHGMLGFNISPAGSFGARGREVVLLGPSLSRSPRGWGLVPSSVCREAARSRPWVGRTFKLGGRSCLLRPWPGPASHYIHSLWPGDFASPRGISLIPIEDRRYPQIPVGILPPAKRPAANSGTHVHRVRAATGVQKITPLPGHPRPAAFLVTKFQGPRVSAATRTGLGTRFQ